MFICEVLLQNFNNAAADATTVPICFNASIRGNSIRCATYNNELSARVSDGYDCLRHNVFSLVSDVVFSSDAGIGTGSLRHSLKFLAAMQDVGGPNWGEGVVSLAPLLKG